MTKVVSQAGLTKLIQLIKDGFLSKSDTVDASTVLSGYVPTSRTVNGKSLSSNISLAASDVGALPSSTVIPTVNNATLTLTQGGTTKGTFTANASSNVTIALDSGGSVDIDNKSITTNSSDEIQTVGVINSRDSSTAIKTWTGTKAQYDAIVTKDSNTLYNITDDTTITQTILEALYPVGSIYITTANTCPLSTLISGSTWTLVSSGIVKAGDIPCKGNGIALGLTNGSQLAGMTSASGIALSGDTTKYGAAVGTTNANGYMTNSITVGITTDATKSGIVADTSSLTLAVNIFERTA